MARSQLGEAAVSVAIFQKIINCFEFSRYNLFQFFNSKDKTTFWIGHGVQKTYQNLTLSRTRRAINSNHQFQQGYRGCFVNTENATKVKSHPKINFLSVFARENAIIFKHMKRFLFSLKNQTLVQ